VKEKLGDSSAEYEAFLQALMTFGKEKKNPAVVSHVSYSSSTQLQIST